MKPSNALIMTIVLVFSYNVKAEEKYKKWGINIPIVSKHYREYTYFQGNMNEKNLGLGLEFYIKESTYLTAGFFQNTYDRRSTYIAAGKIFKHSKNLDFGLEGGLLDHPDFDVMGFAYLLYRGTIKISFSYQVATFGLHYKF